MRQWLVVAEDNGARITMDLVDRLIIEKLDWADGNLEDLRKFVNLDGEIGFSTWSGLKKAASARRLRIWGRFGKGHAGGARLELTKAMKVAALMTEPPDAVVAVRDTDGDEGRYRAFREFEPVGNIPICAAIADPEIEAWILTGFIATSEDERAQLADLTREIGCDPTTNAHTLNPKREHDATGAPLKKSTKRILKALAPGDRQRACWAETPLEDLRERGTKCGLTQFLEDVEQKLVPQVGQS